MANNKTENKNFQLEILEYAFLAEDTDPCAEVFKIYVPKLQGNTQGGSSSNTETTDSSAISNDTNSGSTSSTAEKQQYINARVSPEYMIAHRHKFHDCPGNCVNLTHTAQTCHSGTSTLKVCHHFHHDHHWPHVGDKGMIPAGSRVIVAFMNHDPNDAIVTRLICDFPSGGTPNPPDEHR